MRSFKPPKRKMPLYCGIFPDGTLTILHNHSSPCTVEWWKWQNEEWRCTEDYSTMTSVDHARRPLWVIDEHGDERYPIRVRANDNQFIVNLVNGLIENGRWANEPAKDWARRTQLWFNAGSNLLVMCEHTTPDQSRVNVYTATMDWQYNPNKDAMPDVWFSFFGYFASEFFGFHNNPNIMLTASNFEGPPTASIFTREEGKDLEQKTLTLKRGERMFCGIPLNNGKAYALIGEKQKGSGKVIRFYNEHGGIDHDFLLPNRAHTLLISPDELVLTAVGFDAITQIDIDW